MARNSKKMKRRLITLTTTLILFLPFLFARSESPDYMRSIGKIYVVVAVIVISFIGIVLFLIHLDRKVTKLENQINKHG